MTEQTSMRRTISLHADDISDLQVIRQHALHIIDKTDALITRNGQEGIVLKIRQRALGLLADANEELTNYIIEAEEAENAQ